MKDYYDGLNMISLNCKRFKINLKFVENKRNSAERKKKQEFNLAEFDTSLGKN